MGESQHPSAWEDIGRSKGWMALGYQSRGGPSHRGMPSKSLYRANVLLGLLDTLYFGQVRDRSSLSNCFFILDLWGNGDTKTQLHAEIFPPSLSR